MKTKSHNVSPSILVLLGVSTWPKLEKFLSSDVSAAGIANMKRATFLIFGNCVVPMINEKYLIRESMNPNWIIRENFSSEIYEKYIARPMPALKIFSPPDARPKNDCSMKCPKNGPTGHFTFGHGRASDGPKLRAARLPLFNISNGRGTETTPAVKILGPGTASTGSGGSSKFNLFIYIKR